MAKVASTGEHPAFQVPSVPSLNLDSRAGYKSSPQEEHLAHLSSSDTPVVVMEPTEHGDCVDAAIRLQGTWNRLLVPEAWCGRASL
jgi:hypothetical protein